MATVRRTVYIGIAAFAATTTALDNGVGITPPIGFNTYQSPWPFQGGDALVIADALNKTGLQAAGFVYVNSDAGWQPTKGGRNASGSPLPDETNVAAALHARGFKIGLYSALSSVQCGMAPGGLYHEDLDAASYEAWGQWSETPKQPRTCSRTLMDCVPPPC